MRAILILLVLAGLSFVGYRAWTRAQYVSAAQVAASIQTQLKRVRAEERVKPVITPDEQAHLERTLRAAGVFDDSIDGELPSELRDALDKRFDADEWSSLTAVEQSLIAGHPPVAAALSAWNAGDSFAAGAAGHPGSLSLHFQLVWLGEDVSAASGSGADFAASLIDALRTVAELYAAQDEVAWMEGSRVLGWLEPRLRAKLDGLSESSREQIHAAAELLRERLPSRKQFLVRAQIDELEEALPLTAATGPDAPKVIDNLHRYTQVLETCVPQLNAVLELPTGTDEEAAARKAELSRLTEEYDELPLGPSVLASMCLSTVRAADACHEAADDIFALLTL